MKTGFSTLTFLSAVSALAFEQSMANLALLSTVDPKLLRTARFRRLHHSLVLSIRRGDMYKAQIAARRILLRAHKAV